MLRILVILLFGFASTSAMAQAGKAPWDEFDKRLKASQKVSPLGNNAFGDEVSLSNGALSFTATDVSIPGNSSLPVSFGRSYTTRDWRGRTPVGMMADWDVDVPRLSGVYVQAQGWVSSTGTQARCTVGGAPPSPSLGLQASDFWQGAELNIPGVGGGELLSPVAGAPGPTAGGPHRWMTNAQIHLSCLPTIKNGTGEGFLAITPDGTKYWFDWMGSEQEPTLRRGSLNLTTSTPISTPLRRISLYATRVEDRFGNVVTYTYTNTAANPGRLTQIAGTDGRQISVGYNGNGNVASVSDGTRTWIYAYVSTASGRRSLSAVTLPDTSAWAINFASFTNAEIVRTSVSVGGEVYRGCFWNEPPLNETLQPVGTITHPSGVVGTFTLFMTEHGRSSVPLTCNNVVLGPGGPDQNNFNDTNDDTPFYPISYYALTLKSKHVSGPGLSPAQWDYLYSPGISYHLYPGTTLARPVCTPFSACLVPPCLSEACAGSSITEVRGPNSERTVYTYGNTFRYDEGKLKRVEVGTVGGPTLRTTVNTYDLSLVNQAYLARWGLGFRGNGDSFPSEYHRPLLSTKITQQGEDFTRTVTDFDTLARPMLETQASTVVPVPGAAPNSRTTTTVYRDNTVSWVMGQVAQRDIGSRLMERTTFQGNDLPWQLYGPGNTLVQTLTFNADGTIATATDANTRTTTVSNWYRGIPRNVQFADGTGMSATVSALGWVNSVTDPNGFVRSFGYDAMGRVSQITHPAGDAVAWAPTTIAFSKVAAAEYGIAAGHWRETVSTGNARKETYFDALWRPLLVREYDTANVAATSRFTVQGFDHEGRPSFSAYPLASLSTVAGATLGVWTQYDALGRPTSVGQDADGAVLVTQTNYLAGFQTQSINPRGFATLLRFQAFDTPDTSAPVVVQAPEGQRTTLVRNGLGLTRWMTRDGTLPGQTQTATRYYIYDSQLRLCKSIEPETGATVMDYDAAGNLRWSAAGLNLPDPSQDACTNDRSVANSSGRRVDRAYDARNRVTSLTFPDGRGNQAWTYTPDGLPSQITTQNAPGGETVVNSYVYNRRRLLTQETMNSGGIYTHSYSYDPNGALSSVTNGAFSVTNAPNALGQPTQAGSWATGVQYYPNGAVKQFTYGNGIVHTMTQNARQLPQTSVDSGGALNQTYHYDPNGNVIHVADNLDSQRSRWMGYDSLDRLTDAGSVVFGGDHWHRFTYDAIDNLRSWKLAGVKDLANYVYDGNNRLASVLNSGGAAVHTFSYDVQGNLSNKNSVPHDFDFGNRLRGVPGIENHTYDGHGRRATTRRSDGSTVASVYTLDGQLRYRADSRKGGTGIPIYLGDDLVAEVFRSWSNGAMTSTYQHTDALGSPVAVTSQAGTVIERTNYDPYGGAIGKVIDGIGYTGHVMDPATGLTYMQQRYYDPAVGAFLSVDPVTADTVTGWNFNRYNYAANNPYRFTDPDGRMVQDRWRDQMGDRMRKGRFDNPCGQPICLSAGSGEEKQSRSSEEDDYYAERAQMARRGKETFKAAGKTVAKEAGRMAAGGFLSKLIGSVGRYIGFAGKESKWVLGAGKSEAKWAAQMERRGWTPGQITEAVGDGARFPAENLINKGNSATRYVHPGTGRSVVLDDVTREVIHVGGDGFKY